MRVEWQALMQLKKVWHKFFPAFFPALDCERNQGQKSQKKTVRLKNKSMSG
jgi:hypothetical protein